MISLPNKNISISEVTAQNILNWVLPAIGTLVAIALIIYLWRHLRKINEAGRISEFNEKSFKKLLEEHGSDDLIPYCKECQIPMRFEIRYKDFLKDQGDFLINRATIEPSLKTLVDCDRILQEHTDFILKFFSEHPEVEQQLFKRYRCPSCHKVKIIPYKK